MAGSWWTSCGRVTIQNIEIVPKGLEPKAPFGTIQGRGAERRPAIRWSGEPLDPVLLVRTRAVPGQLTRAGAGRAAGRVGAGRTPRRLRRHARRQRHVRRPAGCARRGSGPRGPRRRGGRGPGGPPDPPGGRRLPAAPRRRHLSERLPAAGGCGTPWVATRAEGRAGRPRSEEHTSELQ